MQYLVKEWVRIQCEKYQIEEKLIPTPPEYMTRQQLEDYKMIVRTKIFQLSTMKKHER